MQWGREQKGHQAPTPTLAVSKDGVPNPPGSTGQKQEG